MATAPLKPKSRLTRKRLRRQALEKRQSFQSLHLWRPSPVLCRPCLFPERHWPKTNWEEESRLWLRLRGLASLPTSLRSVHQDAPLPTLSDEELERKKKKASSSIIHRGKCLRRQHREVVTGQPSGAGASAPSAPSLLAVRVWQNASLPHFSKSQFPHT